MYLIGDSTVQDVDSQVSNEMGWGQQLPNFFTEEVRIINKAKGGRSTKSFIDEGRFQEVLEVLSEGDYLFIQFGHNDQKLHDPERGTHPYGDYQENLKMFIESARTKKAIPILVTPVHRREFDLFNQVVNTLGEYPLAMQEVAKNSDVLILNLWEKSKDYYEQLGPEQSKSLFAWYELEATEGEPDHTHFGKNGAKRIAKLVVEELQRLELPVIKCHKKF